MAKRNELNTPKPITPVDGKFQPLPENEDAGIVGLREQTNKRFADIEQVTKAIMFVAIISLVGIVVAVSGLVLDQLHYNDSNYKQQDQFYNDQIRLLKEQNDILRAGK